MALKNKGHMSFYECCNLTKKVYLMYTYTTSLLDASPQFDSLIYGGQPFKLAFHHRLLLCAAYCCQEIKEACKIERRHSTKAVNWELIFQKEWENSKCGLNISFMHDIYFLYSEKKIHNSIFSTLKSQFTKIIFFSNKMEK